MIIGQLSAMKNCYLMQLYNKIGFFALSKEEIIYTSKYLSPDDKVLKLNSNKISDIIFSQMSDIFTKFTNKDVIDFKIFKSLSAAPSPTIHTVSNLPRLKSPLNNFGMSGLEYIYQRIEGLAILLHYPNKIFKEII